MTSAQRTKDLAPFASGQMTVNVTRPIAGGPYPRSIYGTRHSHGRDHWAATRPPAESILVEYAITVDNGMLHDLEQRARTNKSGTAVRDCAQAIRGHAATVDRAAIPGVVAAAANTKGLVALAGPLRARVKLLEERTPFQPRCALCGKPASEHEQATVGTEWNKWQAYWCPESAV